MTKHFTKTELKRLKYTKLREGMTEKEASDSIKYLIEEVDQNYKESRQKQRAKKKEYPYKKSLNRINQKFKSKFRDLTNEE